jgi:type IX secretion system PorP/SprF family membrane protein
MLPLQNSPSRALFQKTFKQLLRTRCIFTILATVLKTTHATSMRKVLLLTTLSLALVSGVHAQQDAQFSMYMFNRMVLNPAYAGVRGATNFTLCGRTQWVGIDGHPNTFTLSGDAPINLLHGGVGGSLMFDQIGPITTYNFRGAYAFRFNLGNQASGGSNDAALQLGISPAVFGKQIDGTQFLPEVPNDPRLIELLGQQQGGGAGFDLGAGVWFNSNSQKDLQVQIGASIDHILEPELGSFSGLTETTLPRTIAAQAGVRIGSPNKINVTPMVHFRSAAFVQNQIEGSVLVNVSPMVFGMSYRGLSNASDAIAIVGFNANQRMFIAYSYDYTLSQLRGATSGSHEIILSYTFPRFVKYFPPLLDTMDKPDVR